METYGHLCSEYYELDKPQAPKDALEFYLSYAKKAGGRILEPMCGTGRFLIPMVQAGYAVDGFDASKDMLKILKRKCDAQRIQPHVWHGYLKDLNQPEPYPFIFIPSGSLGLLVDEDQMWRGLHTIWKHLSQDGTFVFEAETLQAASSYKGARETHSQRINDDTSIVLRTFTWPPQDHVLTTVCQYDLVHHDRIIQTQIEYLRVRLHAPADLVQILKSVGFSQVDCIESFGKASDAKSSKGMMAYVCRT